jgi:hypothetical protein
MSKGGMSIGGRRRNAFALAVLLSTSCSGSMLGQSCNEGTSISKEQLVEVAVKKLVARSQSSDNPRVISYHSTEEFYGKNPKCCFLETPYPNGNSISLPFSSQLKVAILYRRYNDNNPFYVRYSIMYPCPTNMEEGGSELSLRAYSRRLIQGWGELIR